MTQYEIQQKERFQRVSDWGVGHAGDFPAGKPAGINMATVRAVLEQLGDLGGTQMGSDDLSQSATGRKHAILDAVRADLVGMANAARKLKDEYPDLQDDFHLPDNEREQDLINAANAQLGLLTDADTGAALVEIFTDYGMPDDFVSDLQTDIAAVGAAGSAHNTHSSDRREDTLAIDAQVERGIRAVGKLDAYCGNKYRGDAQLLGAWTSASHLELIPVHRKRTV